MKPLESGDPIRLGPYRILAVLGEGGMGRVYVGQDGGGQAAAVKVLHPHLTHDRNLTQRFVREAQMARAVTGGSVARVLDARTEGGRPWIATEFLTGPTLADAVRSHGPFDEPTVRALAAALAHALRDIHAAGLVHRDLKPANIVLTATGPRVIDFGIARPEHGLTLTATGQAPVTPGYSAPEQVLGQRVGAPADVFSLGAVLVYAASGQHAYEGSHVAAVQFEVVHGEPRLDRVPPALQPLIGPCLAKDPASRPLPDQIIQASAPPRGAERAWRKGSIAQDIATRGHSLHRLTTLPGGVAPHSVSRRRLLTGLAVGGSVLAAGGGTAAWWILSGRGPFDVPPAVQTPQARVLDPQKGDFVLGKAPEPLWSVPSSLSDDSPAPLPVRDVIIGGAPNGGIAARSVVDGTLRWSAPKTVAANRYLSLSDQLVAATDRNGTLVTFVASTGEPKWTSPADAASLLAADDEAVYVITKDGRVRSIGRSDAKVRWTVDVDADLGTKAASRGLAAHGRLVLTAADGSVVALDTTDGRKAWDRGKQFDDGRAKLALSGRSLCLTGKNLSVLDIIDGKDLWSAENPKPPNGGAIYWGPPTIHGDHVYASVLGFPLRYDLRNGKATDWAYAGLLECDPPSPLVVQGNGLWSVAVNKTQAGINVIDLSPENRPPWVFPVIKNPDRYWITADANRVFLLDGASLGALPVF
ncbi:protein kinase [Streptomyces sp. BR123]|uniref:serine/threonine-protein kinase n=1 Tax=Streptomyces sp. BR123 TaxID=2749828 RepID=UPI0015C430AB|nr:serine/threonine-protein kinase [Streptomyces sp. BR123]NXY98943.1 protein kinase [Streptomyces sp. BR123]